MFSFCSGENSICLHNKTTEPVALPVTGSQGIQGLRGETGPQGEMGLQGPQGLRGETGPRGEMGLQGPQGLRGETGPRGEMGLQGPQGLTGPQGLRGEMGLQGLQGLTGPPGINSNISTLKLGYYICTRGMFPSPDSEMMPDGVFIGQIIMAAIMSPPANWVACDGRLLLRSENAPLYALLGTAYGGDGRTTFGVPDLRRNIPLHYNRENEDIGGVYPI